MLFLLGSLTPLAGGQGAVGKNPSVATDQNYGAVRKLEVVPAKAGGVDVTIRSTRAVVPSVRRLKDPERLVVDLPQTVVSVRSKTVPVDGPDLKSVRIELFQAEPPVTRIVLDLLGVRDYLLESNGNSVVVHIRPEVVTAKKPEPPPPVASKVSLAPAPAVTVATAAGGGVMLAGNRLAAGASVTAGGDTATLQLARGGQVRVCPGTTVSVTPSKNGRDLMLGMSGGAIELHYTLTDSSDTVLTPDFRILASGPGEFHYAISADPKGNTCVRALPLNAGSLVVSELMADGTYQVGSSEQVVFRAGRLNKPDNSVPAGCGCAPPPPPVLRAADPPLPPPVEAADLPLTLRLPGPVAETQPIPPPVSAPNAVRLAPQGEPLIRMTETQPIPPPVSVPNAIRMATSGEPPIRMTVTPPNAPLPEPKPDEVHVQVDAPLEFRAEPPQVTAQEAAQLPGARGTGPGWRENVAQPLAKTSASQTEPPPKPAAAKPRHRDVLGAIKSFFASIFR